MSDRAYFLSVKEDFSYGDPVLIDLNDDGSANLSRLPENVRDHLAAFGFPDPLHRTVIMPSDGRPFITSLTMSRNPYLQFRTPEEIKA